MCGIVGLLDPGRSRTTDDLANLVDRMADQVRHRGPDADGVWVDASVGIGFGHRRLSVLDQSDAGAQPMASADGRWVITYNGEIYNFAELSADLSSAGVGLRGHSDTEILVEAIAAWGLESVLARIDGMFAFALWDRQDRRLTLVRDRIGEKPLYYGAAGSEFLFASGLDAFRVHPRFDAEIDRDALCGLLRYKYVPSPMSIYRDANKLPPGHLLTVDEHGVGQPRSYWSVAETVRQGRSNPFPGTDAEAEQELDRLLRSSVRRRMVADVPVGAFLSGGIDSSTIVAAMQRESADAVRTFTIGSPDGGFDESGPARAVAAHLCTDHNELLVTGNEALAAVQRLPVVYDEPFADSSQIPTLLVSEMSRKSVTVALTGDAGDELFGGYNRYRWIPTIHRRVAPIPPRVRTSLSQMAARVAPGRWDQLAELMPNRFRPRQLGLKVHKVTEVAGLDDPASMYLRVVSHWSDPESAVLDGRDPSVLATRPQEWPEGADIASTLMAADLMTYLPGDILAKVDRATMAVGLEGRIPFLDKRVLDFAASLPPHLKEGGPRSKELVRRVLNRYVPAHLVDRPKSGFGIPLDSWLRGPLKEWGDDLLGSPAAGTYFDTQVLAAVWSEHQVGNRNHGYRLWDALTFLAWIDHRQH